MFRSFRLGSLFGFPIHVNVTFLLLLGVVGLTMGGVGAIAVVLLAFGSVLLHELGHALVARHLGVAIDRIELHFFGGAAQMASQPRRVGDEIAIAAAGPAVSFALAGLSLLLGQVTGVWVFQQLGWINLVLGAFNLLPALPMDGGRILRAILSQRMGFLRATEISVTVARIAAVGLAVFGIATQHYYLALLAVLIWLMTTGELAHARMAGRGDGGGYEAWERGWAGDDIDVDDRDEDRYEDQRRRGWRSGGMSGFVIHRDGRRVIIERLD